MIGLHITRKAKNTTVDNCKFINTSIKNEGEGTKILKTKFIKTFDEIKNWSQEWWGQIVVGLLILLIAYYVFGIK